jgi:hypothetical protein
MAREITGDEDYKNALLKLIPSEVIGLYTFVQGVVPSGTDPPSRSDAAWALTIISAALLIGTPFLLRLVYGVRSLTQIVVTAGSLAVWLYTLGGPFRAWDQHAGTHLYVPWVGSIVLAFWSAVLPLVVRKVQTPADTQQVQATAAGAGTGTTG